MIKFEIPDAFIPLLAHDIWSGVSATTTILKYGNWSRAILPTPASNFSYVSVTPQTYILHMWTAAYEHVTFVIKMAYAKEHDILVWCPDESYIVDEVYSPEFEGIEYIEFD